MVLRYQVDESFGLCHNLIGEGHQSRARVVWWRVWAVGLDELGRAGRTLPAVEVDCVDPSFAGELCHRPDLSVVGLSLVSQSVVSQSVAA